MKIKFLVLSLAILGLSTSLWAQPKTVLIYGNAGMQYNKDTGGVQFTSYQFQPGVGYQFNENWTAGLNFGYEGSTRDVPNSFSFVNSQYMVGPFVRYTLPLSHLFIFFNQLNLSYVSGQQLVGGTVVPLSGYSGFDVNMAPFIGIHVKEGFRLNFSFGGVGYQSVNPDNSIENRDRGYFNFGRQASVGVSLNCGGRRMKGAHEPGMDGRRMKNWEDDEDEDNDDKGRRKMKKKAEEEDEE